MGPPTDLRELERENAALRHAITLLHEVSRLVHGALELEATCYAVLTGVTAGVGLGFNRAMLFLRDRTVRGVLEGTMAVGPKDRDEADRVWKAIEATAHDLPMLHDAGRKARSAHAPLDLQVRGTRVRVDGGSAVARAFREGRLVRAAEGSDDLGGLLDTATGLAAPLSGASGVEGVLYADNVFTGVTSDPVLEHVFVLVADQAARAVENARRFEREARAARTDALTGLGHHGALMEHLTTAVRTAQPGALSLVMVDLDDFKRVNDRFGHLAGDALLAGLANRLRGSVRDEKAVYRYGGEEFSVVLEGVGAEGARTLAERLRRAVADEPFAVSDAQTLTVTCSVGVVSWAVGMGLHDFVDAADQALLSAKRSGKNRVVG
jgi:diguanylate cyclase (GGDEF)-like protein